MKYRILIPIFFLCWLTGIHNLYAQVPTNAPKTSTSVAADTMRLVEILSAKHLKLKTINDSVKLQILVGNVKLKQGTTLFMCDSCVINENNHLFEAFGHVHINDSDTANIYSGYMKYLTQTKIAYFKENVKLTDGKGELTTPELEYDMNTKIGVYTKGGRVKNKKTILTSDEGYYYADLKDVYFKKNVVLKDPSYNLKTDSLLYSTAFETARFIAQTVIIDSNKRQITTSDGYYDMKNGKAEFGKRPIIVDGKMTITGDQIAIDDSSGIFQAKGRAIIIDTAQGTTTMADEIFHNRNTGAVLATKKPLMIIKQENDSIYVTADTLFSARLTDLYSRPTSFKKDSVVRNDSLLHLDSVHAMPVAIRVDSSVITDTSLHNKDSVMQKAIALIDSNATTDTTIVNKNIPTPDTTVKKQIAVRTDKTPAGKARLQTKGLQKNVEKPAAKELAQQRNNLPGDNSAIKKDTLKGVNTLDLKENDSTNRYFEAYRNVRIFSDSMQAICDSMFYSFKDSIFRMFDEPVMWANGSQVTGDTILIFTKNKKADRVQVIDNSLLVNLLEKEAYNQVKSSRMDAYFLDGSIDSVRAKGSAECIYYMQDKDSAFTGINQSQSDIMDIYFKNKELNRVVFRSQVKGTLWPIKQKSPSEMRLTNFKWLEARRPKTKYEMFE